MLSRRFVAPAPGSLGLEVSLVEGVVTWAPSRIGSERVGENDDLGDPLSAGL